MCVGHLVGRARDEPRVLVRARDDPHKRGADGVDVHVEPVRVVELGDQAHVGDRRGGRLSEAERVSLGLVGGNVGVSRGDEGFNGSQTLLDLPHV